MKLSIYELLGVEEEEVFKLNGCEYKIMKGEMYSAVNGNRSTWERIIYPLHVLHEAEFERLPFVPKQEEEYWSVVKPNFGNIVVCRNVNHFDGTDIKSFETGLCYRTKAQAEREGIPKMKALMEKWGGKCE